jgi:hypothetical protein
VINRFITQEVRNSNQTKLNWADYCHHYSLEPAIKETDCFFY